MYRPHKEQIIDFPVKERRLFVEGPNAHAAALASFVGVGEDDVMAQEEVQAQQQAMETLAASLEKDNPQLAQQIRAELERKKMSAGNLVEAAKRYFEEPMHPIIADKILDFVVAKRGVGFNSWQAIISDDAVKRIVSNALATAGIEALHFSKKFPTSIIVYGYSRGGSDNGEAAIIGFGRDGDKSVMFGSENESDAILVELSPVKLLSCIGISEADHQKARARLASIVATGEPGAEIVETIVHTFSHAFLKAVSEWAGLDSSSLAEYLFPAAGAFAVYELVGAGISMGGIERMVRTHLRTVADAFINIVTSCMYDPSCTERSGACFACVHLAEVSCQNFNQMLDRRTLLGDSGYLHESIPVGA